MHLRKTFIRFSLLVSVFMASAATLLLISAGKAGAESPEQAGAGISLAHLEVSGVIIRVHPSMFFIRPTHGLQPRTISMLKAERIGLHESRIGEHVTLLVDEGNVLVDAFKAGAPLPDHRIVAGELHYTDQTWEEIKLSTPEGIERFEVDPLASSKLSVLNEGAHVEVELDADNRVVYIQRTR